MRKRQRKKNIKKWIAGGYADTLLAFYNQPNSLLMDLPWVPSAQVKYKYVASTPNMPEVKFKSLYSCEFA